MAITPLSEAGDNPRGEITGRGDNGTDGTTPNEIFPSLKGLDSHLLAEEKYPGVPPDASSSWGVLPSRTRYPPVIPRTGLSNEWRVTIQSPWKGVRP
jgi:hypothetical protein